MERLKKVGQICPKKSVDIQKSKIGLGFEKLDRGIFDPEEAYQYVAESGVKWARLQSGWQRTEKTPGVYDFGWLDQIVDRLISIGVEPWLCLCYGNELYSEAAKSVFGAVGIPPIHSEAERTAWANYVRATVAHFKGRIHYYEIWNEPDGKWCWKHCVEPDGLEYAAFAKATALACREADPECEVIGLATCCSKAFVSRFAESGALDFIDGLSYHAYSADEKDWTEWVRFYKSIRSEYRPNLKIIQGESGTQSRSDGAGALRGGAWTEKKQAKYLLRHLITDLANGVELTSYFSCMDMAEALNGTVGNAVSYRDYGYFGVLRSGFNSNGKTAGACSPKPSYFALQTLCSVLSEEYECCEVPLNGLVLDSRRLLGEDFDFENTAHYAFKRADGSYAVMYWVPKSILSETYEGTVSVALNEALRGKDIYLTDLLDGSVYQLSGDMIGENGVLKNLPATDSPLMLTFGPFSEWTKSEVPAAFQ